MIFAIAVLLLQPQVGSQFSFSAEKIALLQPANSELNSTANSPTSNSAAVNEDSLPPASEASAPAALTAPVQPEVASNSEVLPDAPVLPAVGTAVPMAFIKPVNPMTVSVSELAAENRRKQLMWKGLVIASSGAATFDAWTTRRAVGMGAQELNPLLRPFAGNASLYAAIQVGPALLDYAGKKLMYNRHIWVRRIWWVPQGASFVSSIFCGAHNLTYR